MSTFKEISDSLSAALENVKLKKSLLDVANAKASQASSEYQNAMSKAQSLKQQLTESLDSVLPPSNYAKVMSPVA